MLLTEIRARFDLIQFVQKKEERKKKCELLNLTESANSLLLYE